jgi:hypothetical protein
VELTTNLFTNIALGLCRASDYKNALGLWTAFIKTKCLGVVSAEVVMDVKVVFRSLLAECWIFIWAQINDY